MNIKEIIGNDEIKETLISNVQKNNILNSYMFVGKNGIGKEKIAEEFARMILCLSKEKESCTNCNSCIKFLSNNHPDFMKIESENDSIKINQIRELQEWIYQKPIISDKKIIIINDADLMTEESQNCILKTLEEPPLYAVIILIVYNESKLLNTIKSRCLIMNFHDISKSEIADYIEKNNIMDNPNQNIIDICNGSIGKINDIKNNLSDYSEVENLLMNILNKNYTSILEIRDNAEILYKSKDNIDDLLEYMAIIIYNMVRKEAINSKELAIHCKQIESIEEEIKKIDSNGNFDMCIDEILLKIFKLNNE